MQYGITSETQLIDVSTIKQGCGKFEEAADLFDNCAEKIEIAADICNINVLSVDKKTMQPTMYELAEEVRGIRKYFDNFSENIQSVANDIYNAQSRELEAYRQSLKKSNENKDNENNDDE